MFGKNTKKNNEHIRAELSEKQERKGTHERGTHEPSKVYLHTEAGFFCLCHIFNYYFAKIISIKEPRPHPIVKHFFSLLNVGAHWLQVLINFSLQPCSSNS